ncbi:hypothetical protein EMIHUDRAFT_449653, partial [Emiliania huxleyi CCMP1516]|uniref:Signal recognition particle subunit SRP68 n=2 Tax=Emiliania huxleyi TaxID=2903 RepID=A0A0D3K5N8_EMIH1
MAEDQEEDAPMQDAQDPEEELPELSLDIIDLIKTAQAQHGLRHGDYGRYRSYCSRRLHRLRRVTGCTHGKGRYVKRPLEPESVRDARQLMLPLFCAERAWAFAMQLKRENTQQEARPHYHLLARLAKAAEWSAKLAALCAERADQRTDLEAKAYSAFMHGNVALERENWAPALASFKSTATICTELARVTMAEQAALYKQVAAEVEPSIRFCSYNLRRLGGEEGRAHPPPDRQDAPRLLGSPAGAPRGAALRGGRRQGGGGQGRQGRRLARAVRQALRRVQRRARLGAARAARDQEARAEREVGRGRGELAHAAGRAAVAKAAPHGAPQPPPPRTAAR